MSEHSPTPWQACHGGNCVCGEIWSLSADVPVAVTSWTFDRFDTVPNTAILQANSKIIVERVNGWDALVERAEAAEADARLFRHILEDTQYVLDMVDDKNADVMRRVRNLQIAMQQVLAATGEAVQS